jgi:hypothetical protein
MSLREFDVELVSIALHNVSQEIAEEALSGLEGELARRIDALGGRLAWFAPSDLGEIALGPLAAAANIDAGALRGLIADALVGHVLDAYSAPAAGADGAASGAGGAAGASTDGETS